MNTWSSGYVTEIDYTPGYYRELSPVLLRSVALLHRVAVREGRRLRYLELGFGKGLSLAIHAAACPGEYWGTDFNPAHAVSARHMLDAAGIGAQIRDASFAELAAEDLPEFDVIVMHGIWSWVSAENQAVLVDLIRRKLAFGGLLYISYNVLPGWAPVLPLRHLLKMHADLAGSAGHGIARRIDESVAFAQRVIDLGGAYFADNPALAARLKAIAGQDRNYLAHEYFNKDWQPMPFSELAERLSGAKLEFVASADMFDLLEFVHLTPGMQALLAEQHDPVLRETLRDYLMNRQFRKDLFIRGRRTLPPFEQKEALDAERFCLVVPPGDIPTKLLLGRQEITLQDTVYRPLTAMLAEHGFASKPVSGLLQHPAWEGRNASTLFQALSVLVGAGLAAPAQSTQDAADAQAGCTALNRHLLQQARLGSPASHLASPVTGGGVAVGWFAQLFLAARAAGLAGPADWSGSAWAVLQAHGRRLMKDGKPLETPDANAEELAGQAARFAQDQLPVLTALGVA